jgi:hypothetical protein
MKREERRRYREEFPIMAVVVNASNKHRVPVGTRLEFVKILDDGELVSLDVLNALNGGFRLRRFGPDDLRIFPDPARLRMGM